MNAILTLLVLVTLAGILASLGSALFHLSRGTAQDSRKMTRALTLRIALSLALFALLMLAWYAGLVTPHGLTAAGPPAPPGQ
jgi:hypothetical protein